MTEFILNSPHLLEVQEDRIPLTFHISTPPNINKKTIPIVVLHGYGEYSNSPYMTSLHKSLTSKYNVAIITVNYTGTFTKKIFNNTDINKPYPFLNYSLEITEGENKKNFLKTLYALKSNNQNIINSLQEQNILEKVNFDCYKRSLELLIFKIENNLCDGFYVLERLYEIGFKNTITTMTAHLIGDHQDFGMIQAIDVLTAISHIKNLTNYANLNWAKLSIVGTSHGAYVASMCDKFAPNSFNTIVGNAGWIKHLESELFNRYSKIFFFTTWSTVKENNYWSNLSTDTNFFTKRHAEIRSLINQKHIEEQLLHTKCKENKQYIFSHAINDHAILINEKDCYVNILKKNYNHVKYIRLTNEKMLDGRTFKDLNHGSNVSVKGLVIDFIIHNDFDKSVPKSDFDLNSIIKYSCTHGNYIIDFTNQYPTISFV